MWQTIVYKIAKRILTWFGDIMFATKPPKTKAKEILKLLNIIQPGDIVCRSYNYYLDSYFIPGIFTHSGLVISKDKMIHSIAEGMEEVHPIDFVKDTDSFVVVRPHYLSDIDISNVLNRAEWHMTNKTEYDFLFNDPDKFYCHEFTVDCLKYANIEIPVSTISMGKWPIKFKKQVYLAEEIIAKCDVAYLFV